MLPVLFEKINFPSRAINRPRPTLLECIGVCLKIVFLPNNATSARVGADLIWSLLTLHGMRHYLNALPLHVRKEESKRLQPLVEEMGRALNQLLDDKPNVAIGITNCLRSDIKPI